MFLSDWVFKWQFVSLIPEARQFLNSDISQNTVPTFVSYGGISNDDFIANLLASLVSERIGQIDTYLASYGKRYDVLFFDLQCSFTLLDSYSVVLVLASIIDVIYLSNTSYGGITILRMEG